MSAKAMTLREQAIESILENPDQLDDLIRDCFGSGKITPTKFIACVGDMVDSRIVELLQTSKDPYPYGLDEKEYA